MRPPKIPHTPRRQIELHLTWLRDLKTRKTSQRHLKPISDFIAYWEKQLKLCKE